MLCQHHAANESSFKKSGLFFFKRTRRAPATYTLQCVYECPGRRDPQSVRRDYQGVVRMVFARPHPDKCLASIVGHVDAERSRGWACDVTAYLVQRARAVHKLPQLPAVACGEKVAFTLLIEIPNDSLLGVDCIKI
jgi:hypothetical protein